MLLTFVNEFNSIVYVVSFDAVFGTNFIKSYPVPFSNVFIASTTSTLSACEYVPGFSLLFIGAICFQCGGSVSSFVVALNVFLYQSTLKLSVPHGPTLVLDGILALKFLSVSKT
jgi:hypothetical protein